MDTEISRDDVRAMLASFFVNQMPFNQLIGLNIVKFERERNRT